MEEDFGPSPTRRETGPLLFLSLFLMLLAFFILLNSISTLRETKSRDVLSSVAATFQTAADPDRNAEILVSTIGPILEPEMVLEEIERLWLTEVPFVKFEVVTEGSDIIVELPITQLFVSAEATLRGDRGDLVSATSHVLSARLPGQVVILRAVLFVESLQAVPVVPDFAIREVEAPQGVLDMQDPDAIIRAGEPSVRQVIDGQFDGTQLAMARVGVLAKSLISGGVPADNLEVGIKSGNESRIRFRFFIRDEDRTRVTFSNSESGDVQ